MAQPRRGMISPALEGSPEEDARRAQIRGELATALQQRFRDPATVKDRSVMPQQGEAPWQQSQEIGAGVDRPPMPGGPGGPGGEPPTETMIEIVMGPAIVNADPAVLQAAKQALDTLKREGWPLTRDTVTGILDEIQKGKSPDQVAREFRLSHGG
jgi:hypothetical protein